MIMNSNLLVASGEKKIFATEITKNTIMYYARQTKLLRMKLFI